MPAFRLSETTSSEWETSMLFIIPFVFLIVSSGSRASKIFRDASPAMSSRLFCVDAVFAARAIEAQGDGLKRQAHVALDRISPVGIDTDSTDLRPQSRWHEMTIDP